MKVIELTNEQSRCVVSILIGQNLEEQLKTPILVTSRNDVLDNVLELAKRYNSHFVTNVTTTLVKQTVYEISSLNMVREMVEQFGCYLVFNVQ